MSANFKDTEILFGNQIIKVERGSFITSEVKLMERWGWSKSKVRAFLNNLRLQKMLVVKADTKKTTITLTNYDIYQDLETADKPVKDQQKTSKKPVKDTAKKDKNIRNIKEKEIYKEKERQSAKPPRRKYGEYQHVLLTDQQYEKLKAEFGEEATAKYIRKVDEYCQQYGKKYSDYNLTIRNWMRGDGVAKAPDLKYTFEDDSEKYFGS